MRYLGTNPLVSIIIPTCNRGKYLTDTIESILQQTYENWELLIMDDGSTEPINQIVAAYQVNEPRIIAHYFQKSGITGKLKNQGIALARGELIAFMDSDDLWPPEKLVLQVNALLEYPDAGFSFTNGYNFNSHDRSISTYILKRKAGTECEHYFEAICSGQIGVNIQTVMVWKGLLTNAYLFAINRTFTDFSFIANLAKLHKAVVLFEPLCQRRLHDLNSSSVGWINDYLEHLQVLECALKEHFLNALLVNKLLFRVTINFGEEYLERNEKKKAMQCFWKARHYRSWSIIPFKKIAKALTA